MSDKSKVVVVSTSPSRSLDPDVTREVPQDTPDLSDFGWTTAASGTLASLSIHPSVFVGANSAQGTVTLHDAAPAGGLSVALAADETVVTVPASMTIAAGATSGTFTTTTKSVSSDVRIRITASAGGSSLTALMRLTPRITVSTLSVEQANLRGGDSTTGTATLSSAAPSGGTVVILAANNEDARIPGSITVAAGSRSGTFTIETRGVSKVTEVRIGAWVSGDRPSDPLTIEIRLGPGPAGSSGRITVGAKID